MARNLSEARGKIFIDEGSSTSEKLKAILNYYSVIGQKDSINSDSNANQIQTEWEEINENREKVYQYYEYMQFKRAKFDCEKVEYSKNTGRIIKMEFRFTNKFE